MPLQSAHLSNVPALLFRGCGRWWVMLAQRVPAFKIYWIYWNCTLYTSDLVAACSWPHASVHLQYLPQPQPLHNKFKRSQPPNYVWLHSALDQRTLHDQTWRCRHSPSPSYILSKQSTERLQLVSYWNILGNPMCNDTFTCNGLIGCFWTQRPSNTL